MGFLDSLLKNVGDIANDIVKDVSSDISKATGNDVKPDQPVPFGWRTAWLVIKADFPEEVMRKLNIQNAHKSTWEDGIKKSEEDRQVFVSNPIRGYVLVIGTQELGDHMERLNDLAASFEELQFYVSHDIVGLCGWAKYVNGSCVRRYCYLGESDKTLWNDGAITDAERQAGLSCLPHESEDWDNVTLPGEDEVIAIARAWGVDPTFEEGTYEPSTGFVGEWK